MKKEILLIVIIYETIVQITISQNDVVHPCDKDK
jgi:hypothetical protein